METPYDSGTLLDYIHTLLKKYPPKGMTHLSLDGSGDDSEIIIGLENQSYTEFIIQVEFYN